MKTLKRIIAAVVLAVLLLSGCSTAEIRTLYQQGGLTITQQGREITVADGGNTVKLKIKRRRKNSEAREAQTVAALDGATVRAIPGALLVGSGDNIIYIPLR